MLSAKSFPFIKTWKQRQLAKKVRAGVLPEGATKEEIWEALKLTKPKNVMEVFGWLSCVVHNPDGTLKKDYGLVSCKTVTDAFAKRLVDGLLDSAVTMSTFKYHKMGAGSTSQTKTMTTLVTQQVGAQTGTDGTTAATHGATSDIFRSIGTLTAGSAYKCCEHGVFNASTAGVMLDRSTVTEIDLSIDDIVTWTYELTVTAGG